MPSKYWLRFLTAPPKLAPPGFIAAFWISLMTLSRIAAFSADRSSTTADAEGVAVPGAAGDPSTAFAAGGAVGPGDAERAGRLRQRSGGRVVAAQQYQRERHGQARDDNPVTETLFQSQRSGS